MCEPTTIMMIGMGVSAAATAYQAREQNKNAREMQDAKNQAFAASMKRQREAADQASAQFRPTVESQGAEGFTNQLGASVEERKQAFNDNMVGRPDYASALASTPKNVLLAQDKAFGAAADTTQRNNDNLAQLTGYGDSMFQSGLARNAFARNMGNLVDKATRDGQLLGLDMNSAANNAYKAPSPWVGLIKSGGQMMSTYGAAGGGMPGGSAAGAPAGAPTSSAYGPFSNSAFGGYA